MTARNKPSTHHIWILLALVMAALAAFRLDSGTNASGSNPDAMSIDMDPQAAPANTATSLGSREDCARINENNVLDADEDGVADTLTVDVTVTNIPASNPMISFGYTLHYNESALNLQTADHAYLLSATQGSSSPFNASDPLPDTNGNGQWIAGALDIEVDKAEWGSGILSRLTVSTDEGAAEGHYLLSLSDAVVIDPNPDSNKAAHPPDTIDNGWVAVDQICAPPTPTLTPTPSPTSMPTPTPAQSPTPTPTPCAQCTPTPTPTPSPTPCATSCPSLTPTATPTVMPPATPTGTAGPTPTPPLPPTGPTPTPTPTQGAFARGDVDCSGGQPNSVDALKVLRYVAKLSVQQPDDCKRIEQPLGGAYGDLLQGDINCDGGVTSVDALLILRFVAGLTVDLRGDCPAIGL